MAAKQCIWGCRHGQDVFSKSILSIRTGKKVNVEVFEWDMVFGARLADLSISQTADLLGFLTQASVDFAENGLLMLKLSSANMPLLTCLVCPSPCDQSVCIF